MGESEVLLCTYRRYLEDVTCDTRKLCYRKDDRAMHAMSRCEDMAIRNYPKWRRPPS